MGRNHRGGVVSLTPASKSEAISELTSTEAPEVAQGMIDNLQRGFLEVAGRDESGVLQFRLTAEGKQRVEGMIKGDR